MTKNDKNKKKSQIYNLDRFPDDYPIWERLPKETVTDFSYFRIYRDMTEPRSVKLCAEMAKRTYGQVAKLSFIYQWKRRIEAYEDFIDKQIVAQNVKRLNEMRRRHLQDSQIVESALVAPAKFFIKNYAEQLNKFDKLSVDKQIDLIIKAADKFAAIVNTERLANDMPTTINKQNVDIASGGKPLKSQFNITIHGSKSPLLQKMIKEKQIEFDDGIKDTE